jgi:hypothetical protein
MCSARSFRVVSCPERMALSHCRFVRKAFPPHSCRMPANTKRTRPIITFWPIRMSGLTLCQPTLPARQRTTTSPGCWGIVRLEQRLARPHSVHPRSLRSLCNPGTPRLTSRPFPPHSTFASVSRNRAGHPASPEQSSNRSPYDGRRAVRESFRSARLLCSLQCESARPFGRVLCFTYMPCFCLQPQ